MKQAKINIGNSGTTEKYRVEKEKPPTVEALGVTPVLMAA